MFPTCLLYLDILIFPSYLQITFVITAISKGWNPTCCPAPFSAWLSGLTSTNAWMGWNCLPRCRSWPLVAWPNGGDGDSLYFYQGEIPQHWGHLLEICIKIYGIFGGSQSKVIVSTAAWRMWPCQMVSRAWRLGVTSTKAWMERLCPIVWRLWLLPNPTGVWKTWPFQAVLKAWLSLVSLPSRSAKWLGQRVCRAWASVTCSTIAWKEWRFQAAWKAWHSDSTSTKTWKRWPFQALCKDWPSEISSIKTWKEWRCQAICKS